MDTITANILDVTIIEPKRKHPVIFEHFDELENGETLTIHNDHDPKPLYYQLMAERGNIFTWKYTENGPVWWKVEITKLNPDTEDITIAEISATDIRKIEVFRKYGIDFCCGGKKTLKSVCEEKGLDILSIQNELDAQSKSSEEPFAFNDWSLDFLSEYIVQRHHNYVRKNLPELKIFSSKVTTAHGESHPELLIIDRLISSLDAELSAHLHKEEKILFPYIKQLVSANEKKEIGFKSTFDSINTPINIMLMEHESAGEILAEIKSLTNDYEIPEDACNSYRFLFQILKEFERDLNIHIHLENNILFPKAIELEKSLTNEN